MSIKFYIEGWEIELSGLLIVLFLWKILVLLALKICSKIIIASDILAKIIKNISNTIIFQIGVSLLKKIAFENDWKNFVQETEDKYKSHLRAAQYWNKWNKLNEH